MSLLFAANKTRTGLIAGLWIFFVLLGFYLHRDFGLSWDEPKQRWIGQMSWEMAQGGGEKLLETQEKYYGPAFEMFLTGLERLGIGPETRDAFFMRHFATYLLFLGALLAFAFLCGDMVGSLGWGWVGALCLFFSPQIFGHSFFNSKDSAFMSFFILAVWSIWRLFKYPSWFAAVLASLLSAILIDIRVTGVMVPCMGAVLCVLEMLRKLDWRPVLRFGLYGLLTAAFTVCFWPFLWQNPWGRFLEAFHAMGHYNWGGEVLYAGELIKADRVPWHYIPVWILITTPLLYLAAFVVAMGAFVIRFLRKPLFLRPEYDGYLLAALWLGLPLLFVIRSHAVLYDSWRQMHFIYPALIIFAIAGLRQIEALAKKTRFGRAGLALLIAGTFLWTGFQMIRLHPYEYLYFNRLAGQNLGEIKMKFDLDYWGLTFRKGLEYIVAQDARAPLKIHASNYAGDMNARLLDAKTQARLEFLRKPEGADYFMTNYRWHPADYEGMQEVYTVEKDGAKLMSVFRMDQKV